MKSLISSFGVLFLSVAMLAAQNPAPAAKADLADSQGKKVGTAELTQTPDGVKIALAVSGLARGQHAFHIHAVGKCEGPTSSRSARILILTSLEEDRHVRC